MSISGRDHGALAADPNGGAVPVLSAVASTGINP
jgi:hypothetical protein